MYGARILLYAEAAEQAQARERQLRLALLARGADAHLLFPEIFSSATSAQEEGDVDADVSQDYDRVDWQVPPSEQEWARTVAALAATRVQVPTADPSGGWV